MRGEELWFLVWAESNLNAKWPPPLTSSAISDESLDVLEVTSAGTVTCHRAVVKTEDRV